MVVSDNVPFERPPSLSVQQEFMLRNGRIRSSSSSSSLSKAGLRTGAEPTSHDDVLVALDLSADMSHEEFHNDEDEADPDEIRVSEGREGKNVASKVVVQSAKHFGDNIKKVWKCDLPVELSTEYINSKLNVNAKIPKNEAARKAHEADLLLGRIVEMLAAKFSFPAPYLEAVSDLIRDTRAKHEADESEKDGGDVYFLIQESGSSRAILDSDVPESLPGHTLTESVMQADIPLNKMSVLYFDEDVDDFVSLDVDTLEDFMAQAKKALRVDYSRITGSVIRRAFEPISPEPEGEECQEQKNHGEQQEHEKENQVEHHKTGNGRGNVVVVPSTTTLCGGEETSSGDTAVVPITSGIVEWTPDDRRAETSPYGHWKKVCRRNLTAVNRALSGAVREHTTEEYLQQYYVGPRQWSTLVAVNGIRMKDLDKGLVFSMLRQRQRPLVLEFESRHGDTSESGARGQVSKGGSNSKQDTHLPASIFLAKYSHPVAKALRKQVDKLLKNFDGYEWVISSSHAEAANGSSPQVFVTSLYRSVESELENLGLFDSSTPQGGGVPLMTESHWSDLRMHIETLIFNSIYDHVKAMAPRHELYELFSTPVTGAPDQRSMVPIQTKFAFLSFLTLKDMGMDLPEGVVLPRVYSLASPRDAPTEVSGGNCTNLPEEWRLGIKELCRATEMRSPLKIMQRLRLAVMLLTHAIEGLLGRPLKFTKYDEHQQVSKEVASSGPESYEVMDEKDRTVYRREFIRPAGYYNPVTLGADELMPVLSWAILQANPPALDMAVWLCGEFRHPSNHMGECAYTLTQVSSALEFVKAASWKDFDVEEQYYRQGLQRYEATQDLIIACAKGRGRGDVESVRRYLERGADVNGLSVDQSDSPLSAAIKSRHSDVVKLLLAEHNIDVNLRISPYFPSRAKDGGDSATASKRNSSSKGSKGAPSANKDGNKNEVLQDYTALMIAAFTGQVAMVTLLLDHGADRYLVNEAGDTASSLARAAGHRETARVLVADPAQHSLINVVASDDVFLLRGLMQQESVEVNKSGVVCAYRHEDGEGKVGARVELWGTAIHAAVFFRDVDAANILLNSHRVDTNITSTHKETALMWCGASNCLKDLSYRFDSLGNIVILPQEPCEISVAKKEGEESKAEAEEGDSCSEDEDVARVQLACALLREDADRYATDIHGRTALHWAKYGDCIAAPPKAGVAVHAGSDIPLEELPFVGAKCRSPRLAAVLYYDPARYKIYQVARDGCIAGVRALLDQGVSINDSCPEGWYTPLIAAVYNKDITMVQFLLQFSSIEVNFKGKHQTTALHYAAQEGSLAICGLLLFHKADRSALTTTGLLPIDFALSKGHKEIAACLRFDPQKVSICLAAKHGDMNVFSALINQGVSVNAKLRHVSEKGTHHELTTPLISAVAFGQLDFIKQLMTNKETILANAFHYTHILKTTKLSGEDVDLDATNFIGQTALMYAAAGGDEDLTLYLLRMGANRHVTDKEGRTAAKWAKQSNHPALYMVLICDPTKNSVHEAIREGNMDATIAFFKQEPNPNVRYFSSLPVSSSGNTSASLNVSAHPNPNPHHTENGGREEILDGENPLIVAAKHGRLPIVRLLFRAPEIEIDNVDTFGKTALMHASERGHESIVLALLKQKANRSAMCYSQKRAIDYAAAANQSAIVDILDADPYKVHIHDAAERGNVRHVNALLKQGCPPNYKDERAGKRNRTALMCAASKGRMNVVKLLLSLSTTHSIDIDLQDADGMTALMHAARIGNLEVTGELLTANCKRDITDARGKTAQSHASSHGFLTGTQFKAQLMWR